METTLVQVVAWWCIVGMGGACERVNMRQAAAVCMIAAMVVASFSALSHGVGDAKFYAAQNGNDYHHRKCWMLAHVENPVPYPTEEAAWDDGLVACKFCITHQAQKESEQHRVAMAPQNDL